MVDYIIAKMLKDLFVFSLLILDLHLFISTLALLNIVLIQNFAICSNYRLDICFTHFFMLREFYFEIEKNYSLCFYFIDNLIHFVEPFQ